MMTVGEKIAVNTAIHGASALAGAVAGGLASLPGVDAAPLVTIQTGMAIAIARALGLTLSQGVAEAAVGTALTTFTGKAVASTLMGMIPGVGPLIKGGTAATLTEALGWTLASEFDAQRQ